MSPRDETPANLESFLTTIATSHSNVERLVDPQLYAGTIWPVRDGKLSDYPHYKPHLTPTSFSAAEVRWFVSAALNWQYGLDVSAIVSPTVIIDDLSGQWAQIAMMLAQEAAAKHDSAKPLLVSFAVREEALRNRASVNSWLDDLSRLDVDGFYLVVQRASETYRQHYDPEVLVSLMHICYSLAELNQYHVFVGYTDLATLLLHAVGVTATGAGWFAGLRQFNLRRFLPTTGGRPARPRYSSRPLLNSIYMTDLDAIYNGGHVADALSGTSFDTRFSGAINPENVSWPPDDAARHHWQVLADISRSSAGAGVGARLNQAHNQITQAISLYAQLGALVPFTTETGQTHLDQWLDALNRFRSEAAV